MAFPLSLAALERSRQTIQAAALIAERAKDIARLCGGAEPDEIVVAVVNPDVIFGGAWTIPLAHLYERVSRLPTGGWSFTFGAGTSAERIDARCRAISRMAGKRLRILESAQNPLRPV